MNNSNNNSSDKKRDGLFYKITDLLLIFSFFLLIAGLVLIGSVFSFFLHDQRVLDQEILTIQKLAKSEREKNIDPTEEVVNYRACIKFLKYQKLGIIKEAPNCNYLHPIFQSFVAKLWGNLYQLQKGSYLNYHKFGGFYSGLILLLIFPVVFFLVRYYKVKKLIKRSSKSSKFFFRE